MSQTSFLSPSQHAFQSSFDDAAPNQPWNREFTIQEAWSNPAPTIRDHGELSRSSTEPHSQSPKTFNYASFLNLLDYVQPELSRKQYRIIKNDKGLIEAYKSAGEERKEIGRQICEWGKDTKDEAIVDISSKVGALLQHMGKLSEPYVAALEDARGHLKMIRNIEKIVQPIRSRKVKVLDEIVKVQAKRPLQSIKLAALEQELVRVEAESLVAEAQLTNLTRQNFKEAFQIELAAAIERAEKEVILAKHGFRLLELLDANIVAPGEPCVPYEHGDQARQVLIDADANLKEYQPDDRYRSPGRSETLEEHAVEADQQGNISGWGVTSGSIS
ncbi:Eisosome component PIL1 domain-containing protein [Trichoderma austrokoningii]